MNEVYDKEDQQAGAHDDLGVHPEHREAESDAWQRKFDSSPSFSPDELGDAESSGEGPDTTEADDEQSAAVNPDDESGSWANNTSGEKKKGRFSRRQKAAGGGILLGGAALGIAGFMSLAPLKVIHTAENLQNKFFSSSESAVGKTTEVLLSGYIKKHLLPNLNTSCPNTRVDRSCIGAVDTSNPVGKLYQGWKDGRLETTLANKYDIEFGSKSGGRFYVKGPGLDSTNGLDITDFAKGNNVNLFDTPELSRKDVRAAFRTAIENETYYKRVMYRFKVGRLLERKYNIKRCVVACDTKDDFSNWKDKKSVAAKAILIQRVVEPRSQALGIVMECVLAGGCESKDSGSGVNGEHRSEFHQKLDTKLQELSVKYGKESVDNLILASDKFLEKSFTRAAAEIAVEQIFKRSGSSAASGAAVDVAGKAVPVVGWILAAETIISTMKNAGPRLRNFAYLTNSAAMVSQYMVYRSHADEIKNGQMDIELMGSLASSLGPGIKKDGSGASAEAAPLYSALNDSPAAQANLLDEFFPKSYAATQSKPSTDHKCDDGKTVPTGKLICPEEDLRYDNFLTGTADIFTKPGLRELGYLADLIHQLKGIFAWPLNQLAGLLLKIPILEDASQAVGRVFEPALRGIAKYLIPSPFSEDMDGARNYVAAAGGANVAGMEFAHRGLGGQAISTAQYQAILNDQRELELEQFNQKSFYAKLFDKESSRSLVSQVAVAMPFGTDNIGQNFATSLAGNPFSKIMGGLGSFISAPKAHAQTAPDLCTNGGIFGATCYGYDLGDPIFKADPEEYWEKNCDNAPDFDNLKDIKKTIDWNNDASVPSWSQTGQAENMTTNPCLLLSASIGSAGGAFTDAVLSKDDLRKTVVSAPRPSTPVTGNANLYMIGDSISVMMRDGGGIVDKFKKTGWQDVCLQAHGSQPLAGPKPITGYTDCQGKASNDRYTGLEQVDQPLDKQKIGGAGAVVVSLGTNDGPTAKAGSTTFKSNVTQMIGKIKALNATAKIYWVNTYINAERGSGGDYQRADFDRMNATLNELSSQLGFTVINWHDYEVSRNGADYGGSDVIHPKSPGVMADYIVQQVGNAPTPAANIGAGSGSGLTGPCAPGTKDLNIMPATLPGGSAVNGAPVVNPKAAYIGGKPTTVRLCGLPGFKSTSAESQPSGKYAIPGADGNVIVNAEASYKFFPLYTAAVAAGIPIGSASSFRTMQHQTDLYNAPHSSPVATPGSSNHQGGQAIDFTCSGGTMRTGDRCFNWMKQNAGTYGIKNLPSESWHWSTTGG